MLAKVHRIRKRQEFSRIYRSGSVARSQHLRLHVASNQHEKRWSVSVSTKISKQAVVRNRLRRRLNGLIRDYWPQLKSQQDIVVVVSRDFSAITVNDLRREFLQLCARADILERQ